jgi:cytoskeletal protein RodZ
MVITLASFWDSVQPSAVVSDLGLVSRANNARADSLLGHHNKSTVISSPMKTSPRTDGSNRKSETKSSSTKLADSLSLWKVRVLLGIVIVAIAAALIVAVINAARVFGLISDPSEENARLVAAQKEANQTAEEDPESLTKLLQSHTMRSYGSLFSNALARIQTSPRRNLASSTIGPATSSTDDVIIR